MREILSMIIVLSAICTASGLSLAYLKQTTEPIIEAQVLTYVQGPAIANVYPAAENNPINDRQSFELEGRKIMIFPYKQGGKLQGVALEASGGGYGGDIGVMVGFNMTNDSLLGISVTQMKETPGLGTKIAESKFSGQFKGSSFNVDLKSKGGNIDAVSGATISSTGAVTAVQAAVKDFEALKSQIQQTWQ